MRQLVWETAEELDRKLAKRGRNIRKRRSISQEKLASMSCGRFSQMCPIGIIRRLLMSRDKSLQVYYHDRLVGTLAMDVIREKKKFL